MRDNVTPVNGVEMKIVMKFKAFARCDAGSVLLFFVICLVAILGIVALSFDMGRRASTQTDMQSFVDNVALAAAGELDGQADAITRATSAANTAIVAANEQLKAGTAGSAGTLTLNQIAFYEQLPASDTPLNFTPGTTTTAGTLAATKYTLPGGTTTDPAVAYYVGVRLDTVDVDWMFANIFGNATLPEAAVGAVAVAGNAGYTCEIAPLMVCLPRDAGGASLPLTPGQAIRLQTVGNNAAWNPGEFGYLNIDQIYAAMTPAQRGDCAGVTPESRRQACLLAVGLGACVGNRGVDIQTGQRGGQEPAGFNLPFGIFGQAMNNLRGNPIYATGPHTISGQLQNNSCRADSVSPNTIPFPPDTCLTNGASGASTCSGGRFGNGTWDRSLYVNTNYTFTKPNGTVVQGSFFDFPETNLTRYEFYQREIERAANGGVMNAAGTGLYTGGRYISDSVRGPVNDYNSWDDYWNDISTGFNPIIPTAHARQDNGLPQCNAVDPSANADRRVVVVAGIDCPPPGDPGHLNGDEDDVPVVQYYRVFLISPARDVAGSGGGGSGPLFELFVEVIEPIGGEAGATTSTDTAFRELIQLYR